MSLPVRLATAGAQPRSFPEGVSPMLATLAREPFDDPDWQFEPKLDGIRAIALVEGGRSRILSRRGKDVSEQFPHLHDALRRLGDRRLVIDGEIVALDGRGRPSFQRLQQRLNLGDAEAIDRAEEETPVIYEAFDLLHIDGLELFEVPLSVRREVLAQVLPTNDSVRRIEPIERSGIDAFEWAIADGLEGIMAKRRDGRYIPGGRSDAWLKIKGVQADEFVIGGYTEGLRARASTFGALLLGQYDDARRLIYTGHVGTGFNRATLEELKRRMDTLRAPSSPFVDSPPIRMPVTWVRPELVAEVKFAEWTRDQRLRAPVFLRLREDKTAAEVHRAAVAKTPADQA